jgi:hypothetical protein
VTSCATFALGKDGETILSGNVGKLLKTAK